MEKKSFWDIFFKIICGISAIVFLVAIVIKLFMAYLPNVELKLLLLCFGVAIILPYLSQLDAFGVKVELRKRVEDITGQVNGLTEQLNALPDYVIGSECESEGDFLLAEKYYNSSLKKCNEFWPAVLALSSLDYDHDNYEGSIIGYNRVLELDKDNVWAMNNLAAAYLYAPWPLHNPGKALEYTNRVLEIIPNLNSSLFYKGEALNRMGSYSDALFILKNLIDTISLHDAEHDILYEITISKSSLGQRITLEELNQIYKYAVKNEVEGSLLDRFRDEGAQKRFNPDDLPVILKFLEEHKI
jgi:tetratricopeptide (TPR) repeat protein